jgi:hypothetical protein
MARRPHEPTDKDRKQVTLMAGIGLTHDQIATIIGISDETLRKYYSKELEISAAMMNAQVAQNLFSIATSKGPGAVPSAIFWLKTRANWKEVDRKELTGQDGGPITLASVNLRGLNDKELENMQKLLEKATD